MITLDSLYADSVIIRLLKELDMRYIITANEKDLKFLHEFYHSAQQETLLLTEEKSQLSLSWANTLPINAAHADEFVNMLVVNEVIHQKKKTIYQKFSWITDIVIQAPIAKQLMRGGRARWRIENETFNTLKNQGYHFDHNFGHGYQNLSTVMAYHATCIRLSSHPNTASARRKHIITIGVGKPAPLPDHFCSALVFQSFFSLLF